MNNKIEIIAKIQEVLEESGLQWHISYAPSTKSYTIYICDEVPEELREALDEDRSCRNCQHWGSDLAPCHKCYERDNWEPRDE